MVCYPKGPSDGKKNSAPGRHPSKHCEETLVFIRKASQPSIPSMPKMYLIHQPTHFVHPPSRQLELATVDPPPAPFLPQLDLHKIELVWFCTGYDIYDVELLTAHARHICNAEEGNQSDTRNSYKAWYGWLAARSSGKAARASLSVFLTRRVSWESLEQTQRMPWQPSMERLMTKQPDGNVTR